jgi:arylsulfatase A-like enzyme
MLRQAGYVTGSFGKWGLGYPGSEGDPMRQGFDVFYGYNCQSLAHNYFPAYLWHNDRKVMLKKNRGDRNKQYSPELIQKEVLRFIKKNRKKKFFLYYPMTLPHAELLTREEYMEPFRGKYLPEKSYKGAEYGDPRFRQGAYGTQPEAHAAYVAMVTLLDRQVGEVMAQLRRLGLAEKTLVIFSSDNGPHLEGGGDPDYFDCNGPLRGYKRDLYEGGIREPMIAWWPGHVPAGTVSDVVSFFGDMMPTFASVAGAAPPPATDGISLLPTLLGREGQQQHDHLYWEFYERHGRRALRKGNWKLLQYDLFVPDKTTTVLYDLSTDLGETRNVATQHPEIVQEMLDIMHREHTPNPVWDFPEGVK